MKKNQLILIIALLLTSMGLSLFIIFNKTDGKIASVDIGKVLKSYKGVEDLGKSLEEKKVVVKSKLDTLAEEFQRSLKDFEKKRTSMNSKEIAEAEQKLKRKQDEYSQFSSANEEGLKQEELKIIQKALEVINAKIERYSKAKGYAVVLGITPNGSVLYSSNYIDITEEIINQIN